MEAFMQLYNVLLFKRVISDKPVSTHPLFFVSEVSPGWPEGACCN